MPSSPPSVEIRKATQTDMFRGLPECLLSLSKYSTDPNNSARCLRKRKAMGMVTLVAVRNDVVIGTASVLFEPKLNGQVVAHIEDVVVIPHQQSKGLGRRLVERCIEEASERGCYKVILDCKDSVCPFYQKLGFRRHEVGMRLDLTEKS